MTKQRTTSIICSAVILLETATTCFAGETVNIEQVSRKQLSQSQNNKDKLSIQSKPAKDECGDDMDYQKQVLSNPNTSDIARAEAITKGGGNTAIITQSGNSNASSVVQNGKNNYARNCQNGKSNDLYIKQRGDNNRSDESQIGEYNHKIKIQNGDYEEETTTKPNKK